MLSNIGIPGLVIVLVIALIIFGPSSCRKSAVHLVELYPNSKVQPKDW